MTCKSRIKVNYMYNQFYGLQCELFLQILMDGFHTVSHFSYAPPFQGPNFVDENAGIKHSV